MTPLLDEPNDAGSGKRECHFLVPYLQAINLPEGSQFRKSSTIAFPIASPTFM